MNISGAALDSMALKANDALGTTMLKKALDVQSSSAIQLLQTMPSLPQVEHKGTVLDVQA